IPLLCPEETGPAAADRFLASLQSGLATLEEQLEVKHMELMYNLPQLAYFVAYSLYNGLGTQQDEREALKWLQVSAKGGYAPALTEDAILRESAPSKVTPYDLGETLSAVGVLINAAAMGGILPYTGRALELLRSSSPATYYSVMNVLHFKVAPSGSGGRYGIDDIAAYLARRSGPSDQRSVREALIQRDARLVHTLLASGDACLAADNGDEPGLMLDLNRLEDIEAAKLAPLLFAKGVSLDPPSGGTEAESVEGSALCCAVSKGSVLFSLQLLALHYQHDIPLTKGSCRWSFSRTVLEL
ncbi:hypothetical protein LTR95_016169, partial [Oleoguttula sp. CCFEE 5521]